MLKHILNRCYFFSSRRPGSQPTRLDRLLDHPTLMTHLWLTGMGALIIATAMLEKDMRRKQNLPKEIVLEEVSLPSQKPSAS